MKRFIVLTLTVLVGVGLSATFHGEVFLVVLWVVIGVLALLLILTLPPVGDPVLAWLRRRLQVHPDSDDGLAAANVILGELENIRGRVMDALEHDDEWWAHLAPLPTREWQRHGNTLAARHASSAAHAATREAYRNLERVENAVHERLLDGEETVGAILPHPLENVPRRLADELIAAIAAAADALARFSSPWQSLDESLPSR